MVEKHTNHWLNTSTKTEKWLPHFFALPFIHLDKIEDCSVEDLYSVAPQVLPHKMLDAICRRLIMLKIYTYWIHVFNQFRMGRKTYEAQNQNDIYKNIFKSHLAQT